MQLLRPPAPFLSCTTSALLLPPRTVLLSDGVIDCGIVSLYALVLIKCTLETLMCTHLMTVTIILMARGAIM